MILGGNVTASSAILHINPLICTHYRIYTNKHWIAMLLQILVSDQTVFDSWNVWFSFSLGYGNKQNRVKMCLIKSWLLLWKILQFQKSLSWQSLYIGWRQSLWIGLTWISYNLVHEINTTIDIFINLQQGFQFILAWLKITLEFRTGTKPVLSNEDKVSCSRKELEQTTITLVTMIYSSIFH